MKRDKLSNAKPRSKLFLAMADSLIPRRFSVKHVHLHVWPVGSRISQQYCNVVFAAFSYGACTSDSPRFTAFFRLFMLYLPIQRRKRFVALRFGTLWSPLDYNRRERVIRKKRLYWDADNNVYYISKCRGLRSASCFQAYGYRGTCNAPRCLINFLMINDHSH